MELRIPLFDLDYGPEEEAAVLDVLHSRWLTMGAVTQRFEKEFSSLLGVKYAFGVTNCTHALHLACMALGIGPGDEVIVPSLTFVATANAVLYTGAEVRFADVFDFNNLTISPKAIEKQITARTKAIIVMHYGGYPCQMPEIMEIANQHRLYVVEDAAHAPGASLDEKYMGTWGDVGCFSFFTNKNLATGEGGMVVTNRDDLAEKIKLMRSHGMTSLTLDRHQGHAYTYDVVELGNNYRIDEIRSALGLVQLKKLTANNTKRKEITNYYKELLQDSEQSGITVPFTGTMGEPTYHIFPILLPETADRNSFMQKMRENGVQTSIHYPPIHRFTYYKKLYPEIRLPVTEAVSNREVTLPLYPAMTSSDVEYVVGTANQAIRQQADKVLEK